MKKLAYLMIALGITGAMVFPAPGRTGQSEEAIKNPDPYLVPSGYLSKFSGTRVNQVIDLDIGPLQAASSPNDATHLFIRDWPFNSGDRRQDFKNLTTADIIGLHKDVMYPRGGVGACTCEMANLHSIHMAKKTRCPKRH